MFSVGLGLAAVIEARRKYSFVNVFREVDEMTLCLCFAETLKLQVVNTGTDTLPPFLKILCD